MTSGVDFLMFCLGGGVLVISVAVATRILVSGIFSRALPPLDPAPKKAPERAPETASDNLNDRLTEFQTKRFAVPIARRKLDPRAFPPPKPSKGRSYSSPPQPAKPMPKLERAASSTKPGTVVQFPTKPQKTNKPDTGEGKED